MDDWKIKTSVLWLFALLADFIAVFFTLLEPGVLQQFIETRGVGGMQITPEYMLLGVTILLFMLVMSFLPLTLKDKANRWANIIVPRVYLVLYCGDLIESLVQPKAYRILLTGSDIIVYVMIIWYAWKSKQIA